MRRLILTSRVLGAIAGGATLIALAGSALADDKPEFAKWFRYSPDVEAAWKVSPVAGFRSWIDALSTGPPLSLVTVPVKAEPVTPWASAE